MITINVRILTDAAVENSRMAFLFYKHVNIIHSPPTNSVMVHESSPSLFLTVTSYRASSAGLHFLMDKVMVLVSPSVRKWYRPPSRISLAPLSKRKVGAGLPST